MRNLGEVVVAGVVVVVLIVVIALLITLPVKWLVNDLFAPSFINSIFGVTQIGFWKAMELSLLSASLFKSSVSKKNSNSSKK